MFSRIGTKLYLALGLAVLLTLLSSGVGVYYFEVSGDLNHRLSREAFPAYEGAWQASEAASRLSAFGEQELQRVLEGRGDPGDFTASARAEELVAELRDALSRPAGLPGMSELAEAVMEPAWGMGDLLAGLDEVGPVRSSLRDRSAVLRDRLSAVDGSAADGAAPAALHSALSAPTTVALDRSWDRYAELASDPGVSNGVRALAEGDDGVFAVRESWLSTGELVENWKSDFTERAALLEIGTAALVDEVSARTGEATVGSLVSFDQGRVVLFGISAVSVLVATLASWLWVGNMVLRRLSRISERMRSMAAGDLSTPVPEVGRDEIGQLADALEVFRQQALEVQRLNLVERLYGELRQAHEELEAMQERLVAQEKLAALGGIASGVAHEISNPLSFVKNFAEGSQELSDELFEMLDGYREHLDGEDAALLDDIKGELSESLERVGVNGNRALTIVRRMQSLGVVGGEPSVTGVHPVLRRSVQLGCDTFAAEWGDFTVEPEYRFSDDVSEAAMVASDFNEAVVNLVSNACYAMRVRREAGEVGYAPSLVVGTELRSREVAVTVLDNGTGISSDVLPRIYDPFFTTRDGALGAGLGLPLAADVARRGGGDLTVETEFGAWTRFTLTLPLKAPPGAAEVLDERYDDDLSTVRAFAAVE